MRHSSAKKGPTSVSLDHGSFKTFFLFSEDKYDSRTAFTITGSIGSSSSEEEPDGMSGTFSPFFLFFTRLGNLPMRTFLLSLLRGLKRKGRNIQKKLSTPNLWYINKTAYIILPQQTIVCPQWILGSFGNFSTNKSVQQ